MKKTLLTTIFAIFAVLFAPGAWAQSSPWQGSGTQQDPYLIRSVADLNKLSDFVNGTGDYSTPQSTEGLYFVVTTTITYSGNANFTPIGGYAGGISDVFRGHFDGQGNVISGIRFSEITLRSGNHFANHGYGLFGVIGSGAVISNFILDNCEYEAYHKVGGIAGINNGGTITNCVVTSSVVINGHNSTSAYLDQYSPEYRGGIVGFNNSGTVSHCVSSAHIKSFSESSGGGSYVPSDYYPKYLGGIAGSSVIASLSNNIAIGAKVPTTRYEQDANENQYGYSCGAILGEKGMESYYANNYYVGCYVNYSHSGSYGANPTVTGVGSGNRVPNTGYPGTVDITNNDGAMPAHLLTLASNVNSTATYAGIGSYVRYASKTGDVVTLTYTGNNVTEGYHAVFTVTRDDNSQTVEVTPTDATNATFTMPDANVSVTVNIQAIPWAGSGTENAPYIIQYPSQWDLLSENVNSGTSYSGTYFRLDADINVTTMVGSDANGNESPAYLFSGNFNGNGHTITFTYSNAVKYTGLFRFIDGATIRNLKVAGTITNTNKKHAGGIVAYAKGNNLVENCLSSVTINSSLSGDNSSGGIIGQVGANNGVTQVVGCLFKGSLIGNGVDVNGCGGIIGYASNTNNNSVTNCIFDPVEVINFIGNTIGRQVDENHITNCYYKKNLGTIQGKYAYTITGDNDVTVAMAGDPTVYNASGITAYSGTVGLLYNNGVSSTIIAGTEEQVNLNLSSTATPPNGYAVSYNATAYTTSTPLSLEGTVDPTSPTGYTNPYTLTMYNTTTDYDHNNAIIHVNMVVADWAVSSTGNSENDPYIIYTPAQLDLLATRVNAGTTYSNKYFKLGADISYSYAGLASDASNFTAIGNINQRFSGHFDGDNKTISGIRIRQASSFYQALFGAIASNAEVKNLTLADADITGREYSAGIVGYNYGTVTNCTATNTVTIRAKASYASYHGGIVGGNHGNNTNDRATVSHCTSSATLTVEGVQSCTYYGGIVGMNYGLLSDNLVIGATVPAVISSESGNVYGAIAGYNSNPGMMERNYYRNCTVAGTANAIGVGCHAQDLNDAGNTKGAVSVHSITPADAYIYVSDPATADITIGETPYYVKGTVITLAHNNSGVATYTVTRTDNSTTVPVDTYEDTFTLPASDVTVSATYNTSVSWRGTGTEQQPYKISNLDDWNALVTKVNTDGISYSGVYFRLAGNITINSLSSRVGTDSHKFSGHFDGNRANYTLTLAFSNSSTGNEYKYPAPFRYVDGADIYDLHVTGSITSREQFASGIVGHSVGNTTITNCLSTVAMSDYGNSSYDGTFGGFISNINNGSVTISGCVFAGSINYPRAHSCGGFVGWTEGDNSAHVTIENCVFKPTTVNTNSSNASSYRNFARTRSDGNATLTNCYYITKLGSSTQGTQAYTSPDAGNIYTQATVAGETLYLGHNASIAGVNDTYEYTGTTISITPTVSYDGTTLGDENYSIVLTKGGVVVNEVNAIGDYTYTVTANTANGYYGTLTKNFSVITFDGDGTENNPYIIANVADWNRLVNEVAGGQTFSGSIFRLDADITVTTRVGDETHKFSGTFDGNGHELTVNYGNSRDTRTQEYYCAPFRYVDGATIENLWVSGNMSSWPRSGGIVGNATGSTTINNCRVNASLLAVVYNQETTSAPTGGLVGQVSGGTTTITGCLFDGVLKAYNSNSVTDWGGFVGVVESGATLTIQDGLFNPSTVSELSNAPSTQYGFAYGANGSNVTITNCYYGENVTSSKFTLQGKRIRSISGNNVTVENAGTATVYGVSGITGYGIGIKYNNTLYAGNGDNVSLNLSNTTGINIYIVNAGTLSGSSNPYSLTMPDENVTIELIPWSGNGTEESPYLITSESDWNNLSTLVNGGANYSGKYFQLTNSISVSNMVGASESNSFKGTFDGAAHTLTFNKGTSGSRFSESYCALFRYVYGATIKNLIVDGVIYSNKYYASGLIGRAKGSNRITNCRISVTIDCSYNGYSNNGGLIGWLTGGNTTTIEGCVFDGKLLGSYSNQNGGFVGSVDNNSVININNCLFAPTQITTATNASWTFVYVRTGSTYSLLGTANINNSYYTQAYGTAQGKTKRTISAGTDVTISDITLSGSTTSYNVSGITAYADGGLVYNSTPYVGSGDRVSFNLGNTYNGGETPGDCEAIDYFVTGGLLIGSSNPYTLIMPDENVTVNYGVTTAPWSGTGESNDPYIISCVAQWDLLGTLVNAGEDFNSKYFKLGDDISVTTMIGTESHPFTGTFDGDGHTLTVNIPLSNEQGVAPFHYIAAATIKNLMVEGTASTSNRHAAGLVGFAWSGVNNIQNCWVKADVNSSSDYAGGIVGHGKASTLTITGCAYSGTITVTGTNYTGGLLGWCDNANITISNSLFAGAYSNSSSGHFSPIGCAGHANQVTRSISNTFFTVGPVNLANNNEKSIVYNLSYTGEHVPSVAIESDGWYAVAAPMHDFGVSSLGLENINDLASTPNAINSGDYDLFYYDEPTATWKNQKPSVFSSLASGIGYIYRRSNNLTLNFVGLPTTGSVSVNLTNTGAMGALAGFNLVGNPYQSDYNLGRDWYELNVNGTWLIHQAEENVSLPVGKAALVYTGSNTTLNFTQGSKGSGTESMRSAGKNLTFSVMGNGFKDVAYVTFGTESGMPKIGHMVAEAPSLSIPVEGLEYAIAVLDEQTENFPMELNADAGDYTITLEDAGLVGYCHLIDKVAGEDIDLLKQPFYSFTATGNDAGRFLVKLSPNEIGMSANQIGNFAHWDGQAWRIDGSGTLQVFDVMGRQLFELNLGDDRSVVNGVLRTADFPGSGVYILRLGERTQKIVVK